MENQNKTAADYDKEFEKFMSELIEPRSEEQQKNLDGLMAWFTRGIITKYED